MRKAAKAPVSLNAIKLLTNKLSKLADNQKDRIEIINNSIMNGWKGFYALKNEKQRYFNGQKDKNISNDDMLEWAKKSDEEERKTWIE